MRYTVVNKGGGYTIKKTKRGSHKRLLDAKIQLRLLYQLSNLLGTYQS